MRASAASIGEYRKAGDDVDFCWRLQTNGGVIAFSPSAIVWHYRRFTLRAFRKQQEGYGEAESMLRFKHLIFFGPTGTAKWKGQIYGAPRFTWLLNRPVIYHGVFGHGLFQSIYPSPQSEVAAYVSSIEWVVLTGFMAVLGVPLEKLRIVPLLMFGATFLVALSYMLHARIERRFDTVPARLLVAFLAFMQPLGRGWARYFTWLRYKHTPRAVICAARRAACRRRAGAAAFAGSISGMKRGRAGRRCSPKSSRCWRPKGWRYSSDTGWKDWDLQIYGNQFWSVQLRTVTEYHGGPKCLTRVRLRLPPRRDYGAHQCRAAADPRLPAYLPGSPRTASALDPLRHLAALAFSRGWRLKRRVADLVIAAAERCQLTRVHGKASRPMPGK